MTVRHALVAIVLIGAAACGGSPPEVVVLRAPDGASLPQMVIDEAGVLQLIYYTGSMSSGDLWHVSRAPEDDDWSPPRRVNSTPHSVHGLGPIDGGQLAIGPDGLLHATWFHKDPNRFFYARTDHTGVFQEQQTLSMHDEQGIEAAPTVTVDREGNVYVFWHSGEGEEAGRRVHLAVSRNNGVFFDLPRPVSPPEHGACGCCGLSASVDHDGVLRTAYRAAGGNVHRSMRLLTSVDQGRTFEDTLIQPWEIGACPVATTTFAVGAARTMVAWETQGQVHVADVASLGEPFSPPGEGAFRRKNPTVATNEAGDLLLAWGDGPGYQSGGAFHWQLFDRRGGAVGGPAGGHDPIPARSVPTMASYPDGSFVIVY